MTKLIIACDFDDVVMPFNEAFIPWHNYHHGTSLTYGDIVSYDMSVTYGVASHIMVARVLDFCQSDHHHYAEPSQYTVPTLHKLKQRNDLQIVTNRANKISSHTIGWIDRFTPDIFSRTHFANVFGGEGVARKKSEICLEIGASVLIEDALHNAEEVAKVGIIVLMPDRPWNREYTPDGVKRVYSWAEIYDCISYLEINRSLV